MYKPVDFFDKYHTERLLKFGIKTKFAEYIQYQNSLTMFDKIKQAFGFNPPEFEIVSVPVWWRYSGMFGCRWITVKMPYRQWQQGDTLINALILEFDKQQKGRFLRGADVKDFKNQEGIKEFTILYDPIIGRRYWNFFK